MRARVYMYAYPLQFSSRCRLLDMHCTLGISACFSMARTFIYKNAVVGAHPQHAAGRSSACSYLDRRTLSSRSPLALHCWIVSLLEFPIVLIFYGAPLTA